MAMIPIVPPRGITGISPLTGGPLNTPATSGEEGGQGFKDVFLNVIDNAEKTEAVTKVDAYKLSIGEVDDLHTMMINAARADAALSTMVQLRNKIIDAYSEIMRINL